MKGHYEGGGYCWEPGEIPMCSMCDERVALYATAHLGVMLCGDSDCHTAYVMQECYEIEFFEDEGAA